MKKNRIATLLLVLCPLFVLVSGCARYRDLPDGSVREVGCAPTSAIVEKQSVTVPAVKAEAMPSADYVIGANDVLYVNIDGKPEFLVTGVTSNTKIQGSRVDGKGDIQIPIVGEIHVAGLTLKEARLHIIDSLSKYLKNPWVVVEVAEYHSHPLYLLGQFKAPGTYYMDRPLTLIQGHRPGQRL